MPAMKEEAIQMIQQLPDKVTADDIFSELYFKLQVDLGIKELDESKSISYQQVKEQMSKWIPR
ncbi:MAG: hypothetical protein AAB296_05510 [Candidatus Desantisbacteria bacterium]